MPRFTSKRCETDAGVPAVTVRKPELGELDRYAFKTAQVEAPGHTAKVLGATHTAHLE